MRSTISSSVPTSVIGDSSASTAWLGSNPNPGATISADIEIRRVKDVLTVGNKAILFLPKDFSNNPPEIKSPNQRAVWIKGADGRPVPRIIEVDVTDGMVTQVVRGELKEGDQVITSEPTPQRKILRLPFGG